jgi:hypothetical protein
MQVKWFTFSQKNRLYMFILPPTYLDLDKKYYIDDW